MSVINRRFHDRFGNQLFQYMLARGYAEMTGARLHTAPWIGQQIFALDDPPIERDLPQRYDMDYEQWAGERDIEITGWGLHQKTLLYTRSDAKRWLRFHPEVLELIESTKRLGLVCHQRHKDFLEMGDYIAIRSESYFAACTEHDLRCGLWFVSEASAKVIDALEAAGIGFLADFMTMMRAKILLRANSTFSWWAATLGENERVFAPKLDGITPIAGEVQHVPFVEGNWPAISCRHPNCSDLHLKP